MSSKTFWRVLAILVVAAAALVGGIAHTRGLNPLRPARATGAAEEVESAYQEALEVVRTNYAGEVEHDRAGEAAIQGMLWSLDPHSNFFTASDYAKLLQDQESRFTGIGVSIQRHRDAEHGQRPADPFEPTSRSPAASRRRRPRSCARRSRGCAARARGKSSSTFATTAAGCSIRPSTSPASSSRAGRRSSPCAGAPTSGRAS